MARIDIRDCTGKTCSSPVDTELDRTSGATGGRFLHFLKFPHFLKNL
jgi:hypothetical protein